MDSIVCKHPSSSAKNIYCCMECYHLQVPPLRATKVSWCIKCNALIPVGDGIKQDHEITGKKWIHFLCPTPGDSFEDKRGKFKRSHASLALVTDDELSFENSQESQSSMDTTITDMSSSSSSSSSSSASSKKTRK